MKTLKVLLLIFTLNFAFTAEAQIWKKLGKKAEKAVERTLEKKVEQKSEKETSKVFDSTFNNSKRNKKKNRKKNKKNKKDSNSNNGLEKTNNQESNTNNGLEEVASNSDFKRGNSIIFEDSFVPDAIGDFPAKWNTTGSGEVKNLNGFNEKWFKIAPRSTSFIEFKKSLPENFTIELDLILPSNTPIRWAAINLTANPAKEFKHTVSQKEMMSFYLYSTILGNQVKSLGYGRNSQALGYTYKTKSYTPPLDTKIKIAIAVNGTRYRVYIDGKKIIDLPKILDNSLRKGFSISTPMSGHKETAENYIYISNVIVAESTTDKRSLIEKELIDNGSFTTSDILFASGSDIIENSSETILNEIGNALKKSGNLKFQIIGHTDSDGSESTNQSLSEKRANAVKAYLETRFNILTSNLTALGKGENQPIASNNSSNGKAKNRRVEFKKI